MSFKKVYLPIVKDSEDSYKYNLGKGFLDRANLDKYLGTTQVLRDFPPSCYLSYWTVEIQDDD